MLFMYIHTHPVEKCLLTKPEEAGKMFAQFQAEADKAGVKALGLYPQRTSIPCTRSLRRAISLLLKDY